MNADQLQNEFDELKKQIKQLKQQFKDKSKELFHAGSKSIFDTYPTLESFGWQQYTPYFNDGDACTFRVNVDYPKLTFTDGRVVSEYDYGENDVVSLDDIENGKDIDKTVVNFLSQFDDDIMLDLFEDHAEVTIHRDGTITIEEYSHD
jgi:hypothetical protein